MVKPHDPREEVTTSDEAFQKSEKCLPSEIVQEAFDVIDQKVHIEEKTRTKDWRYGS